MECSFYVRGRLQIWLLGLSRLRRWRLLHGWLAPLAHKRQRIARGRLRAQRSVRLCARSPLSLFFWSTSLSRFLMAIEFGATL